MQLSTKEQRNDARRARANLASPFDRISFDNVNGRCDATVMPVGLILMAFESEDRRAEQWLEEARTSAKRASDRANKVAVKIQARGR